MIQKLYIVTCDKCGCQIDYYKDYKPSTAQLRKDMPLFTIINGKQLTFCITCAVELSKKK